MAKADDGGKKAGNGKRKSLLDRFLTGVEVVGNKLPDPAILFLLLLFVTWIASAIMAPIQFTEIDPNTGEAIRIQNQLTGEALATFMARLVTTFTSFAPLGVVLVALLGVGVAEKTGFISTGLRLILGFTPRSLLTPMLILAAIVSHTAADAGYVLVIPLGGVIFLRRRQASPGRHLSRVRRCLGRLLGQLHPLWNRPAAPGLHPVRGPDLRPREAGQPALQPGVHGALLDPRDRGRLVPHGPRDRTAAPRHAGRRRSGTDAQDGGAEPQGPPRLPRRHGRPGARPGRPSGLGVARYIATAQRRRRTDRVLGAPDADAGAPDLRLLPDSRRGPRLRCRHGEEPPRHRRRHERRDGHDGLLPGHGLLRRPVHRRLQQLERRPPDRARGRQLPARPQPAAAGDGGRHRPAVRGGQPVRRLGFGQVGRALGDLRADADEPGHLARTHPGRLPGSATA